MKFFNGERGCAELESERKATHLFSTLSYNLVREERGWLETRPTLDNVSEVTNGRHSKGCCAASDSHIAIEKSWNRKRQGEGVSGGWDRHFRKLVSFRGGVFKSLEVDMRLASIRKRIIRGDVRFFLFY